MLSIQNLIDDANCYETVRKLRWLEGVRCAPCDAEHVTKRGRDTPQPLQQKYRCQRCGRYFDNLTGTVLTGHHQPLRTWILGLYLMGSNLSNQQIAYEPGLNKDDVQRMTKQWWDGVVARQPAPGWSREVECDEVSVVAGHKGHPEAVKKRSSGATAAVERGASGGVPWRRKSPRFSGCFSGVVRGSSESILSQKS